VKIEQQYQGQAIKVAHALWGAGQMMFNKIMIIVDDDIALSDYQAVMRVTEEHYLPEHDTYFSQGPLDVLDHSTATNGFGGKMCIDATRKAGRQQAASEKLQAKGDGCQLTIGSKIIIQFDKNVDTTDFSTCAWLLGNNVNPTRDCSVEHGQLLIDARSKITGNVSDGHSSLQDEHKPQRWPNIICMDAATIAAVDRKWDKLGLGTFLPSPSLKFQRLVRKGGAQVQEKE
jgi:4-hydroxy-3-polyprenylbenzoate decarboxylase